MPAPHPPPREEQMIQTQTKASNPYSSGDEARHLVTYSNSYFVIFTLLQHTIIAGENKKPIRRMDSMEPKESDMGFKSENEDDTGARSSRVLGRTPNHLSLSTTSTLSTGSNTSQAKLVQVRLF